MGVRMKLRLFQVKDWNNVVKDIHVVDGINFKEKYVELSCSAAFYYHKARNVTRDDFQTSLLCPKCFNLANRMRLALGGAILYYN
jgi:hypothetical protein